MLHAYRVPLKTDQSAGEYLKREKSVTLDDDCCAMLPRASGKKENVRGKRGRERKKTLDDYRCAMLPCAPEKRKSANKKRGGGKSGTSGTLVEYTIAQDTEAVCIDTEAVCIDTEADHTHTCNCCWPRRSP